MRVLITRPRSQATGLAEQLRHLGAEVAFFPTIEIKPVADPERLDRALTQLAAYDWLILTSANAVDTVLGRMAALGISSPPQNLHVAAVGSKTAARLEAGGISPHFVPDQHLAEAILPGLGELRDRWILLPLADIAHDTLPRAIEAAGGIPHVVTAYHTCPAAPDPEGLAALRAGVDWITFTSGSTAQNFFTLAQSAGLDPLNLPGSPKVACIGPKTAQTARELGFEVSTIAIPHTAEGLAAAIQEK